MRYEHFKPPSGRRGVRAAFGASVGIGVAAVALATGAGAAAPVVGASIDAPDLPAADTWSDRGIDPALVGERASVRVRLVLRDQALLSAAVAPDARSQLQPTTSLSSRRGVAEVGGRITQAEQATALEAEASYEDAVEALQPSADETADDIDRVAAQVRRSGGKVLATDIAPAAVVARLPEERIERLAQFDGVQAVLRAPKPKPQSGIGWQAVGAPAWHSAGFTGGTGTSDTVPADAGVTGELPDPTHPAFAGITVDNDPQPPVATSDHGTHTAGVIASGDSTYRGVAYGVDHLVNGTQPYQLGFTYDSVPGAPDPAEVLNVSFGSSQTNENGGDGDDIATAFFGVSQALSAGNENVDGSPTVQNLGRNTMSVGGFNDLGTVSSTDDVVLGISSRGPTPGGRKKPDLIAPGGAVVSADSAWNSPPANPDYTAETGTSFSSPHVAGAMTLLEGAGITDPMAQRALLINSARDWDGANVTGSGWTAPQTGWRPEVGWGELDLNTALAQRSYYRLDSVPEGEAAFYRATVPAGSKATMAFQLRGYFVGYPNPGTQTLKYTQSNLDLHQYDASDAEVAPAAAFDPPNTSIDPGPDAIDPNDTIEQVRSPGSPGSQQITYKVQSASTIDGASAEPFAIAAAGPLTPLASPTVRPNSLGASAGTVRCGQPVVITTTARNDSPDLTAENAALGIELPAGVSLMSGSVTQVVSGGTLATATTSESHAWTVQANSEGVKAITVRGAGDAYGTTFRDADQVSFTADCTPPSTAIDTGPSGPTNDSSPSFGFSAQGGGVGFECSLDAGAFAPCVSPYAAPTLADGSHTFRVRATDGVGNVDPAPATRAFTIDTVPPDTAITSGPSGPIRATSATFRLAGGSTYQCSLDDGGFSPCESDATVTSLEQGSHVLAARAIDEAGNIDPDPASRSFVVDTKVTGAKPSLKGTQRFGGRLAARVKVRLGEAGDARAVAKGKAGSRPVTVKSDRVTFGGAGKATLRLVANPQAAKEISGALEDGIVKLRVTVTCRDELGNSRALKRRLKLRPPGGGHR